MAANIAIGLLITAVTFFLHSVGLIGLTSLALRTSDRLSSGDRIAAKTLAVTIVASGLVVLLGAEITLWAVAFLGLGVLPSLEDVSTFPPRLSRRSASGTSCRPRSGVCLHRSKVCGVPDHRLVGRLPRCCRHPFRPLRARNALLSA